MRVSNGANGMQPDLVGRFAESPMYLDDRCKIEHRFGKFRAALRGSQRMTSSPDFTFSTPTTRTAFASHRKSPGPTRYESVGAGPPQAGVDHSCAFMEVTRVCRNIQRHLRSFAWRMDDWVNTPPFSSQHRMIFVARVTRAALFFSASKDPVRPPHASCAARIPGCEASMAIGGWIRDME